MLAMTERPGGFAYDTARSAVLSEFLKPVLGSLLMLDSADDISPPLSSDLQVRVTEYVEAIEIDDMGFIGVSDSFDEYGARVLLADVIEYEDMYT